MVTEDYIGLLNTDLKPLRATIEQKKPTREVLSDIEGINYFGEPLLITYENGHFEAAIEGLPESTLTYDITSEPPTSWFISFQSGTHSVHWEFFEPCISELNQ